MEFNLDSQGFLLPVRTGIMETAKLCPVCSCYVLMLMRSDVVLCALVVEKNNILL